MFLKIAIEGSQLANIEGGIVVNEHFYSIGGRHFDFYNEKITVCFFLKFLFQQCRYVVDSCFHFPHTNEKGDFNVPCSTYKLVQR